MYFIRKIVRNKKGATAIEYGLIAALVAIAAVVAMRNLGTSITKTFSTASSTLNAEADKTPAAGSGTAK